MRQEVNLYQETFRRRRKPFSAGALALSALVMAAGLLALSGHAWFQLQRMQGQVEDIRAQVRASDGHLARVQEALAQRREDRRLTADIQRLERLLWQRRRLLAELTAPVAANTTGFSPYLAAISRHSTPELWLETISISRGGAAVDLAGRAAESTALPRYIRRLGSAPVFSGKAFSSLELDRPQEPGAPLEFKLRGSPGEET